MDPQIQKSASRLLIIPLLFSVIHCGEETVTLTRRGDNLPISLCEPGKFTGGFGVCGIATLSGIPQGYIRGECTDIEVLSNGKILVSGGVSSGTKENGVVIQLTEDGKVDTTFGQQGSVLLTPAPATGTVKDNSVESIAILADGNIIAVGSFEWTPTPTSLLDDYPYIARIKRDGTIDSTCKTGGYLVNPFDTEAGDLMAVTALSSGGYYAAGNRVNLDKSENAALVTDLPVAGTPPGWAFEMAGLPDSTVLKIWTQSDGKIFLAGQNNGPTTVSRFNSGGVLDTSFGTGGEFQVSLPKSSTIASDGIAYPKSITPLPNGNILFVASTDRDATKKVARLLPNMALDPSFGANGIAIWDWSKERNLAQPLSINDSALQPDGKLVIVGSRQTGSAVHHIFLARFLENGSPDPSFGDQGMVTTILKDSSNVAQQTLSKAVALQADGKILVAGLGKGPQILVARYLSNGRLDEGTAPNSK